MPKLVTVLRPEKIDEQARYYVRSHILLPAGTIGLVCMVGGVGSLGYQLLVNHTYSWITFLTSSILLAVGAACGWGQARYHRYLFTTFPDVYAAKMRTAVAQRNRKARAEPEVPAIEHPGRAYVTAISIAGAALIFGASAVAIIYGELDPVPAVFVPWAAFYWAKLFSWRGVVD
jgi:signal transduction histidine kinase